MFSCGCSDAMPVAAQRRHLFELSMRRHELLQSFLPPQPAASAQLAASATEHYWSRWFFNSLKTTSTTVWMQGWNEGWNNAGACEIVRNEAGRGITCSRYIFRCAWPRKLLCMIVAAKSRNSDTSCMLTMQQCSYNTSHLSRRLLSASHELEELGTRKCFHDASKVWEFCFNFPSCNVLRLAWLVQWHAKAARSPKLHASLSTSGGGKEKSLDMPKTCCTCALLPPGTIE